LDCSENQLSSLDLSTNINLIYLYCHHNQLISLNITSGANLLYLYCQANKLQSLDISNNINLKDLGCSENQLTQLDVSANKALQNFYCDNNKITSLDISANVGLGDFRCNDNQLTSLNGKNGHPGRFWAFYAFNNPNLTCVQVDDVTFSTNHWNWTIDSSASFSEICTVGTDNFTESEVKIFPNPCNGIFTISGLPLDIMSVDIYNLLGEIVCSNIKSSNQTKYNINISDSPKGIYLVNIYNDKIIYKKNIIIE